MAGSPVFSHDGRRLLWGIWSGSAAEKGIRAWDLEGGQSGLVRSAPHAGEGSPGGIWGLRLVDDESVVAMVSPETGSWSPELWFFDLASGGARKIADAVWATWSSSLAVSPDHRSVAYVLEDRGVGEFGGRLAISSLEEGSTVRLPSHGSSVTCVAFDPTGRLVVTGDNDGTVRVGGPISGAEPHLLFGHEGGVGAMAVSPDGRWIASGGRDRTVRLWPMPDLSKPPPHTLPYEQFLAKLKSLTNLRVVEDDTSPTGYKLETGPFPGWEEVPEW